MSRFRRLIHNVASGYVVLAATAVYSVASVPLALYYLSPARFGVWTLMASLGAYASLIDFGMSGAVARLLIDHKDDWRRGTYGSLIKTGTLVLLVQGALVFLAGFGLAPLLCKLLKNIPADLQGEFVLALRWQIATWGLGFATRIFGHLLYAHQRNDVGNYNQVAGLALNFAAQWYFFRAGQGILSLVWAGLLACVAGVIVGALACCHLRLFPPAGAWGRVSGRHFNELFDYGKDMFLVIVGAQLIMFSQSLIITRCVGLQAAAAWNVGTRAFTLLYQSVWRIFDSAGPVFAEMIARGERALLGERYKGVVVLTFSLTGLAAVGLATCNSTFVTLYTHAKIAWPPENDVLLGLWMIAMTVQHCHNSLVNLTKNMAALRYIYFVEGLVFVMAAFLSARQGGVPAVIVCSIVCTVALSAVYGVWRVSRYFNIPICEVGLLWLGPMARVLLFLAPAALIVWWGSRFLTSPLFRLSANALLVSALGSCLFLRCGVPHAFQRELLQRSPRFMSQIIRWVFPAAD